MSSCRNHSASSANCCVHVQLNLVPGRKGLRTALGEVPSWVAFQDKEKVEVGSTQFAAQTTAVTGHNVVVHVCSQLRGVGSGSNRRALRSKCCICLSACMQQWSFSGPGPGDHCIHGSHCSLMRQLFNLSLALVLSFMSQCFSFPASMALCVAACCSGLIACCKACGPTTTRR